MEHIPTLVNDLALILIVAGIVTLLFKLLKQPVVLGYVVAGFLISPNFSLLPSIAAPENITVWADIGVIFLLFALGLEFSFKKLLANGSTIMISTVITMVCMMTTGYFVGFALGWNQMECIFLSGMLSMSSTMIIIKAFDDMGLKKKKFAGIVFGMLIVEDLVAILMLVLLSAIAIGNNVEGTALLGNVVKLVFFVLIWFVVGIFLIPTWLNKLKRFLNDETLMVVSIGLCLGMVMFATKIGFSAALGAFVMGSILAESAQRKQIEHLIAPLKNLFGAVFFVSVGTLIVPGVIVEYSIPILIITGVVIVGVLLFATFGIIASGESLKTAIQSSFSLAQIGEFSFIIATLGMQLGVVGDFLYPIIVTVSVVTTFITPFLIKASNPVYEFIEKRIPAKWNKLIVGYGSLSVKHIGVDNEWNTYLKSLLTSVMIYGVISAAILILTHNFLYPFATSNIEGTFGLVAYSLVTILAMSPFINGIIHAGKRSLPEVRTMLMYSDHKLVIILLNLLKSVLATSFIAGVLIPVLPHHQTLLIIISIVSSIGIVLFQRFWKHTEKLEQRFIENLKDKEEEEHKAVTLKLQDELQMKSIHIERFTIPQNSVVVGKTLAELNFRKHTGISIVSIIRGNKIMNVPNGHTFIYPFDKIVIVGSDEEVQRFQSIINLYHPQDSLDEDVVDYRVEISQYVIPEDSPFIGNTIRELNIQRKTKCLITGIKRNGDMITKFNSYFVLSSGDILWLTGEQHKLENFEKALLAKDKKTYRY